MGTEDEFGEEYPEELDEINDPEDELKPPVFFHDRINNHIKQYGIIIVPIYIFSFVSFLTTASGLLLFVPPELPVLNYILSGIVSIAIQTTLLACAFNIRTQKGSRNKWIAIYIFPALVSMMFSYLGIVGHFSEGAIDKDKRKEFREEFSGYSESTNSLIKKSRGVIQSAKMSVEIQIKYEVNQYAAPPPITSKYLRRVHEEQKVDKVDIEKYRIGSGKGPRYHYWVQLKKELDLKEKNLKESRAVVDDALRNVQLIITNFLTDKIKKEDQLNREDQLNSEARKVENSVNWEQISDILKYDDQEYTKPAMPRELQTIGHEDDREKAISTLRETWNDWDNTKMGLPMLIAVMLDLVVLLMAVLFTSDTIDDYDEVKNRVINTLQAADLNHNGIQKHLLKTITNCMHTGGKVNPKRWYLNLADIEKMDIYAVETVNQLSKKGVLKEKPFSEIYIVSKVAYEVLFDLGNELYGNKEAG